MTYFCTLFDSFYLRQGLVMYRSLLATCPNFQLFIIPFDAECLRILTELNLDNVTLISLYDFENPDLLGVKSSRSTGEYCWTSTPYAIEYVLDTYNVPQCTYLDADLCFFGDPAVLLDEMKDASILITEHRYTPEYDQSVTSGIYCVQFLSVRNNAQGRSTLSWWRDRCLEWCYSRVEDGKFGDQKYLDDWITRFQGVHVLQHLGGGVAPWNVQQYELTRDVSGKWWVGDSTVSQRVPLIFYHFHYVKFLDRNRVDISPYRLSMKNVYSLYADYLRRLDQANELLDNKITVQSVDTSWRSILEKWRRTRAGTYNVFKKDEFIMQWRG